MSSDLTSASVPAVGTDDHVHGQGAEAIVYLDLGCPHCAAAWIAIRQLPLRLCFRHFPVASKHRRAAVLHAAVEAAAMQGGERAFWGMCDRIYGDQGHQDDPHLWARARELGLELERFEQDRRSETVWQRVRRDFESGIRAGVTATPAAFVARKLVIGDVEEALAELAEDR